MSDNEVVGTVTAGAGPVDRSGNAGPEPLVTEGPTPDEGGAADLGRAARVDEAQAATDDAGATSTDAAATDGEGV